MFLSEDPTLKALEMNETDSSSAFACNNKWILLVIFVAPADSTLDVVHTFSFDDILATFNLHGLS